MAARKKLPKKGRRATAKKKAVARRSSRPKKVAKKKKRSKSAPGGGARQGPSVPRDKSLNAKRQAPTSGASKKKPAKKKASKKRSARSLAASRAWKERKAREALELAQAEKKRARDRERRAEKKRAAELEAERLRKEAATEKRREAGRKGWAKRKACEELAKDPGSAPEIVWGSDCFHRSMHHTFPDGSFEGEIVAVASQDEEGESTLEKLGDFTAGYFKAHPGAWCQVAVYGFPPDDADVDEYDILMGRHGKSSRWRRIGAAPNEPGAKWTTLGTMLYTGEQITQAFAEKGFSKLVVVIRVYTGRERPA